MRIRALLSVITVLSLPLLGCTAEVPDGDTLSEAARGDDGVACLTPGSTYRARWDDGDGNVYYVDVQAGGNWNGYHGAPEGDWSCLGDCGAGCTGTGPTLDCLEHDVCAYFHAASGGRFDRDCGDEWQQAVNDYLRAPDIC